MIIKNQVKDLFETYADPEMRDDYITEECLKKMFQVAQNDPEEFKNLIDLFNEQDDVDEKLNLSDVLTDLKYLKVKDFLLKVIEDESDIINQIWAAGNLLKFEDERGAKALRKLVKKADYDNTHWILDVMERANNKMSTKLFLELADKHEKINKLIDRSYFEEKLKNLK